MPELPEMENYKRLLTDLIKDKKITDIRINRTKSINVSEQEFVRLVKGQVIKNIERRAKHLIFQLENGFVLLLHLMLGGWMFFGTEEEKPDHTVQVQVTFQDKHLFFFGLRLGYLHLLSHDQLKKELDDIGPEPLNANFSLQEFNRIAQKRRGRLKTTLLDQAFLAGIGNRYTDEINWYAKLSPITKINQLEDAELILLYQSIRSVLSRAIEYGGYMNEPLFRSDTKTGGFLPFFKVYNQEGKKCERCGTMIVKEKISSRNTFYCPNCQQ